MNFPAEDLDEVRYLNVGDWYEEYILLENHYITSGRWSERWEMIFRHNGKFWGVMYEVPSTEMQEGMDSFDQNLDGTVDVYEVEPYEVTVTKYRKA